jgi:hypothetical protein
MQKQYYFHILVLSWCAVSKYKAFCYLFSLSFSSTIAIAINVPQSHWAKTQTTGLRSKNYRRKAVLEDKKS